MYSKHTRSERIVDTIFFKNNYLTSPIVTLEDTVVESPKRLTYEVTYNSKSTEFEQMDSLKQLTNVFKKIAEKNAQEVSDKQPKK